MNITVQLNPGDYHKAHAFITKRMLAGTAGYWFIQMSGFFWGLLLGLGGFMLFRFVLEYDGFDRERLSWGFWMIVAGGVFFIVHRVIVKAVNSNITYRPGRKMLTPVTYEVRNDGLACQSGATRILVGWEDIYSVEEDRDFAYVFYDKHYAAFFPRRSFPDQRTFGEFVKTLKTYSAQNRAG